MMEINTNGALESVIILSYLPFLTAYLLFIYDYHSTFVLAWIVLPIQMEYHNSGQFSFSEKVRHIATPESIICFYSYCLRYFSPLGHLRQQNVIVFSAEVMLGDNNSLRNLFHLFTWTDKNACEKSLPLEIMRIQSLWIFFER
jgi:hypothetical protein